MTVSIAPAEELSVLTGLTEITRLAGVGTAVSATFCPHTDLMEAFGQHPHADYVLITARRP